MKPACLAVSAALAALAAPLSAQAYDEDNWFNQDWRIYLGAFHASVDSRLRINSSSDDLGTDIDVEDLLGVDDSKTTAWGGIGWQFANRHSVELEFFALNRSAGVSDTFSPPIEIGDFILEGGSVNTSYDTNVTRLTYGFSAFRNERSDLKLLAGIHVASLDASIGATGNICTPLTTPSVPPGCPPETAAEAREDVTAPLPHIGASWAYALSPKWAISLGAIGFALELDNIDGSIVEIDADLAWQPWKNFGFGLGARYFKVDVDSRSSDLNGKFEFEYLGPAIFVQAVF